MDRHRPERQQKSPKPVKVGAKKNFIGSSWTCSWCRRSESNRHGRKARWILSPVRQPNERLEIIML